MSRATPGPVRTSTLWLPRHPRALAAVGTAVRTGLRLVPRRLAPGVTVAIAYHRTPDLLETAIARLRRHDDERLREVLIVDNGSRDGVAQRVSWERARVVSLRHNAGHGWALDVASWLALTEVLVTLDSDAWPIDDGWLERLLRNLEGDVACAGIYEHRSYIHPSCAAVRLDLVRRFGLSFTPRGSLDVGERIGVELGRRGFALDRIRRDRQDGEHWIGATYGGIVYHAWYGTRLVTSPERQTFDGIERKAIEEAHQRSWPREDGTVPPSRSGPPGSVVVAEPQFKGPAHSTVNAALLAAASSAFPGARPAFYASAQHGPWVRRALEASRTPGTEEVDWQPLPELPSLSRAGRLRRVRAELAAWRGLLAEARRRSPEALLVCSVTRTGILLLKAMTPLLLPRTPVFAVVHQLNELIGDTGSRAARLAALLTLPAPRNLTLLAPAEPVFLELRERFPRVARRLSWIDLPYLWQEEAPAPLPEDPGALVFGFFGVGRAGRIESFCELAGEVRRRHPRARFVLLGHLDRERPDLEPWRADVEGLEAEPLSLDALRRRARQVHYALWTSPEERYRMTFSASFLDALSFVKPCVFLDNRFIAHYQEAMGDIGFRCRDRDEIAALVGELLEGRHAERYAGQCRAILDGRRRFAPERAARSILRLEGR